MSSEGSVSSRLSQFGLYRNIDARTEEFLKLSKKRQIKQGCVCAAVSTALTVTVVVTVLLIYEYNVIGKARRDNHKTDWLSLMNYSADDSNLLEILNKENIDIDKTTVKLLPILLKAINRNYYKEKLMDEPTSRYTSYENNDNTETTITKNIFADTRNWLKTPPPRFYTIEYKTSPIVYFKNPTRNIEYFTKIRKIREYQRVLNYVDKMISEKNNFSSTQPMRRDYGDTENPYKITTASLRNKQEQRMVNKTKMPVKTTMEEKQCNCKCSHKLSEVIYKLLSNMQQLLTYFSRSNTKEKFSCTNNTPTQTNPSKSLIDKSTIKNMHMNISENYNNFEPILTKAPTYNKFLNRRTYTIDTPTKSFDIKRDHTINAIMNIIKPNFKKYIRSDVNFDSNEDYSRTNSYTKTSESNSILKEFDISNTKTSTDSVTTVTDYVLEKRMYYISSGLRSPLLTFREPDFNEDIENLETTETIKLSNLKFKRLDTNTTELVKNTSISGNRLNVHNNNKLGPFKGAKMRQKLYNNIGPTRKIGNLVPRDKAKIHFMPYKHRFVPISNQSSTPKISQNNSNLNYKFNITSTVKPTRKITLTTNKQVTVTEKTELKYNPKRNITNKLWLKHKTYEEWEENISKESTLEHIEEAIMILNNGTTVNQVENYNSILADTYDREVVEIEENATTTKSMVSLGRSTYLEMQRKDWKQDQNHDFDNDINYIFD